MLRPSSPISFILLLYCFMSTHAQAYQPVDIGNLYSSFREGQALYIGGGDPLPGVSVDLSVSWNASKPKYQFIPAGTVTKAGVSTMSSDGRYWIARNSMSIEAYDTEESKWTTLVATTTFVKNPNDLGGAVTDLETGLIYIQAVNQPMMRLDLTTKEFIAVPGPIPPGLARSPCQPVWSTRLRKIFCLVDTVQGPASSILYTYSTVDGWKDIKSELKGQGPGQGIHYCMVPAYGGSKLIVYGHGEIYELDVTTMSWMKGPDVVKGQISLYAACAASGDYFIAFGNEVNLADGNQGKEIVPLVYNMKTKRWTDTFIATPAPSTSRRATITRSSPTSSPTVTETPSMDNGKGTRVTDIVVSIVVLAVVAIAIGIFLGFHSRRRRAQNKDTDNDSGEGSHRDSSSMESSLADGLATNGAARNPHPTPSNPQTKKEEISPAYYADNYKNPHLALPNRQINREEISPDFCTDNHRNPHPIRSDLDGTKTEIKDDDFLLSAYPNNPHTSNPTTKS
ncbi:hypothetical protein B0O80DRAFT_302838 [Mortierella sp. GBAus27b]|nr:hypothetical protein B0O80DRAFT_302838 [Mortierella sp. GBAus27b]